MTYGFCFSASSSDSFLETFDYGSQARWTQVDDELYLTEPGNWVTFGGVATETTDAYGNYPGDDAVMGTYFILDGVYDEFIAEMGVVNNDNDAVGFLFGWQSLVDHYTATEISDVWPSPAADGYSGPAMKIRQRDGRSAPHLSSRSSPFTLLDSPDGDDGVSVNKAGYSPYDVVPAVVKAALKVECCDSSGFHLITYQSTRLGGTVESVTGRTTNYRPGQIGLFMYSHTVDFDNLRITPLNQQPVTIQLRVTLGGAASNVYTIFGDTTGGPLTIPAAFQVATPFGVDTGGVSPSFYAIKPPAEYDSWLTVGVTDASQPLILQLSTIGLDFLAWTEAAGLSCANCAVFLMDPDSGPGGSAIVAQLTVSQGSSFDALMGLQGRSSGSGFGNDWSSYVTWSGVSTGSAAPPPPSRPPPPLPPAPATSGLTSVVTVATSGPRSTVRLVVTLDRSMGNVYAFAGTRDTGGSMSIPAAFQAAAPFGVDIGGANPAFFAFSTDAEYDSWLTVGMTEGDTAGQISTIGIDFQAWTEAAGIASDNGALFWMDPPLGPGGSQPIVMAQITSTSASGSAGGQLQGRSAAAGALDWVRHVSWAW